MLHSWYISGDALKTLMTVHPKLAERFFNRQTSFIEGTVPAGWVSQSVKNHMSLPAYQADTAVHTWVLYDPEKWSLTPLDEQQHPRTYIPEFIDLAHSRGAKVILTPARDLCSVSGGDFHIPGLSQDQSYLQSNVPAVCATADVFECQAQALQSSTSAYRNFVKGAKAEAKPGQPFWAGLTTLRSGNTATELYDCYEAVASTVDGFWLNTSSQTISIASHFLSMIALTEGV